MRKNTSRAFQATAAVAGVAALGMTFAGAAAADVLGGSSGSGSDYGTDNNSSYGTDNGPSYGTDNGSSGAGGLSDLSGYRLGNLGLSGFKMPTSNEIGNYKVPGIGESDKGNHDGTLQLLGHGYGGNLHTSSNDSGGLGDSSGGNDSSGGDGFSDGGGSGSHDSSGRLNGLGNGSHEGKSKPGSSSRDGGSGGLSSLTGDGLGGHNGGGLDALSGHQFGS